MLKKMISIVAVGFVLAMGGAAQAGLFLIDLSDDGGSASGWDVFTTNAGPTSIADWSGGGDNDVTLTIAGIIGEGTSGAPGSGTTVDGVAVPKEANDDYVWDGTNPGSDFILFEFQNLDAGQYNVSVFEGRTTDSNGQYGTIWAGVVGDDPGSQNTGNFAGSSSTLSGLTIGAGDSLFYRHLEDGTGGTSGIIVRSAPAPVPEPGTLAMFGIGCMGLLFLRHRRGR